jgi:hypothetical protein
MNHDTELINGNPKYMVPFCASRLIKDYQVRATNSALLDMYGHLIDGKDAYLAKKGSDLDFFAHSTMHLYMLCKNKLTPDVQSKIKDFMELHNFIRCEGTLNMRMMTFSAGFIASEEWSDFTDSEGHDARSIFNYTKDFLMKYLDIYRLVGCEETDAPIYFVTNLQYVRLLAEYAKDKEISAKANAVYQQMIASMIAPYNDGLYIANPPRAKGWSHLMSGSQYYGNNSASLAWLLFGGTKAKDWSSSHNLKGDCAGTFIFWIVYPGRVKPNPIFTDFEKSKTYPYEYRRAIESVGVNKDLKKSTSCIKYKFGYQSRNFGLCSQSEFNGDLSRALKSYLYKETKRNLLGWVSDEKDCIFSVCQDNPFRPTDQVHANGFGYGENPYQRVLQCKGAVIGIYNVAPDYISGKRYQIYVPFTKKGIKLRKETEDGWILCHTGSMMFAFKSNEPCCWNKSDFVRDGYDILALKDKNCRKGSWILQTTEITPELKANSMDEELKKFETLLRKNTNIKLIDYESSHPQIDYTSINGDKIELTFFGPTEAYNNQYVINHRPVVFDKKYIFDSPYVKQKYGEPEMTIVRGGKTLKLDL